MRFIDGGFELSKPLATALASVRNTRKGAHPACRLWCWDPVRGSLHVIGESMLLRCVDDIVTFAENEPRPHFFDVEVIRKEVLPHVRKGTYIRLVTGESFSMRADVVQEDPEETLCSVELNHECCPDPPAPEVLDEAFPRFVQGDHGRSSWYEISPYLHQSHLDSLAKVMKALKVTAARFQPPQDESDTTPVRVDLAAPPSVGRWAAMLMKVRVSS